MTIIIIIAIYLIGCVWAYLFNRSDAKSEFSVWTKGDRIHAILLALFSYIAVFAIFMTGFDERFKNLDKPAKW